MKLFEGIPRLEGEGLVLRAPEDTDAAALEAFVKDPEIYRYLPAFLCEQAEEDVRDLPRRMREDCIRERSSAFWTIGPS